MTKYIGCMMFKNRFYLAELEAYRLYRFKLFRNLTKVQKKGILMKQAFEVALREK